MGEIIMHVFWVILCVMLLLVVVLALLWGVFNGTKYFIDVETIIFWFGVVFFIVFIGAIIAGMIVGHPPE